MVVLCLRPHNIRSISMGDLEAHLPGHIAAESNIQEQLERSGTAEHSGTTEHTGTAGHSGTIEHASSALGWPYQAIISPDKLEEPRDFFDKRNRGSRCLPSFMFTETFPKDHIGAGGPTFSGALDWLQKHKEYFNQALSYIQRYPHLVEERCMDHFWDFIQPLVYNSNLLCKYDDFLRTQFGYKENFQLGSHFDQPLPTAAQFFKTEVESKRSDYQYPVRRVFLCYDRTCPHQQEIKHLIVDALEPFLCVRTNPTKDQASVIKSLDVCRSICGSVFIMIINDAVLKDLICLHLLKLAIAYHTPILFIRESGYKIPANIEDEKVEYIRAPTDAPFIPLDDKIVEGKHQTKKTLVHEKPAHKRSSEDIGERKLREKEALAAQKAAEEERYGSLAQAIRNAFASSIVFSIKMFESSVGAVYERIAAHVGLTFPGSIPRIVGETESTKPQRPYSAGGGNLIKKLHRSGSARTTRDFYETINYDTLNINLNNASDNTETENDFLKINAT